MDEDIVVEVVFPYKLPGPLLLARSFAKLTNVLVGGQNVCCVAAEAGPRFEVPALHCFKETSGEKLIVLPQLVVYFLLKAFWVCLVLCRRVVRFNTRQDVVPRELVQCQQ